MSIRGTWGIKIKQYASTFGDLEVILIGFCEHHRIDVSKLGLIDSIIESAQTHQFELLDNSHDLDTQMVMFSGFRNIENTGIMLKEKLETASDRCENPTTAELALDLMPHLISLSNYLDKFVQTGRADVDKVRQFTRNLYKKSKALGFSRDVMIQLKEAGITTEEIRSFVESLNNNLDLELEEGGPADENTGGDLSTS